jgi:hypothetical protein
MKRAFPSWKAVKIFITAADMDDEGWVSIENAINRTFATDPFGDMITPADLVTDNWFFDDNNWMAGLNTVPLTVAHTRPGYVKAGVGFNAADFWPIEKISIRFENREVVSPGVYNPTFGNGNTLNSIVVNNDAEYVVLEAQNAGGMVQYCQEFDLPPTLVYTAYHPHLLGASLRLYKNGGGYNHLQNDAPLPIDNTGVRPGITNVAGSRNISPVLPETCIYIAELSYSLRLTTGRSNWTGGPVNSIFYYHKP